MGNPSETTILIEGALAKRRCSKMSAMTGKSWDLRWCVLTSSSLTYYRSLEDRDWGGAGTVLSLSSLKRFESISSLVFQLYFYQRILQLRAAQEQEAHSRVSYSPLSEHAVASPFMSDALRQQFIDQAHSDGAAREPGSQMDSRQATSSTATASDHQDEGADIGIRTSKTLTFAEPSTSHRSKPHHERSQSAGQALEQQQLAVTSRSASYQPSTSSPFDHATGGLFASEDIEQLYALPEGARAGRLHCSEDWEPSYDTQQQSADSGAGSGKIPDSGGFGKQGVLIRNLHCLTLVLSWSRVMQTRMLLPAFKTKVHQDMSLLMSATHDIQKQAIVVAAGASRAYL
ncbi:hypothetical protein WJX79_010296 [Trebouxia sp. C0005]